MRDPSCERHSFSPPREGCDYCREDAALARAERVQDEIRFGWWGAAHTLLLISPAVLELLPDGISLACIDGTRAVKGVDPIDGDTRYGLLAYGFALAAGGEEKKP